MVAMEPLLVTQEEQAGGSSANYDVELIHLAEAHRDILRAGVCVWYVCCSHFESQLHYCILTYMCICKTFSVNFHSETRVAV